MVGVVDAMQDAGVRTSRAGWTSSADMASAADTDSASLLTWAMPRGLPVGPTLTARVFDFSSSYVLADNGEKLHFRATPHRRRRTATATGQLGVDGQRRADLPAAFATSRPL